MAYRLKRPAVIPTFMGMAKNAQGEEVEQVQSKVYAEGQVFRNDLPPSYLARLEAGDEHLESLLEEISEEEAARGDVSTGGYDPSQYTAEDVLSYLRSADDAEVARVIEAERGGQARKTVLDYADGSEE